MENILISPGAIPPQRVVDISQAHSDGHFHKNCQVGNNQVIKMHINFPSITQTTQDANYQL